MPSVSAPYEVLLTRNALKQLAHVPASDQERIRRAIGALAAWPKHGEDVRPVKGRDPGTYRLRQGEWRVLFCVWDDERQVVIGDVLPRGRAYARR